MWEILRQNAPILSAFASIGSFGIWFVYAVLFYKGFKRQRSAHLYVHAAGDGGPGTECLVINLSPEPVHVLCSIAARGEEVVQIQSAEDERIPLQSRVKQGPLKTGECLSLGGFEEIVKALDDLSGSKCDQPEQHLEIRVAAIHGASDRPIGAVRGFYYDTQRCEVTPDRPQTVQKRSRREAREVRYWMERCGSYRKDGGAGSDEIPEKKQEQKGK